jgi:hypothetical protein
MFYGLYSFIAGYPMNGDENIQASGPGKMVFRTGKGSRVPCGREKKKQTKT